MTELSASRDSFDRFRKPHPVFIACGLALAFALGTAAVGCQSMVSQWQNPFASAPPAYKTEYGPTPRERMRSLQELGQRAPGMTSHEAARTATELNRTFADEPDPIIRRELIKTAAAIRTQDVDQLLQRALTDTAPPVRTAACHAWGLRPGHPMAAELLNERLRSDTDVDVRRAAIDALASVASPESVYMIAEVLEDHDPAMQVVAIRALTRATSTDLGNDVKAWRDYVKSLPRQPAAVDRDASHVGLATAIGE